jgi:hypothetical protein
MSATLGRPPAPAAGFDAGVGLDFFSAGGWSAAAAGASAGGSCAADEAGAGEAAAPFPSADLAAARISATDIFFLSAIESLGGTGLDQTLARARCGLRMNRDKTQFRPELEGFVIFFTNSP